MKKMKKLLAGFMAATMVMSMSVTAFADETTYEDMSTIKLTKTYKETNDGTTSPAETFEFSDLTCTGVKDAGVGVTAENAPVPTIANVEYAAGEAGSETATKEIVIRLPEYNAVGIYTYTFTETDGNTAGVTYRSDAIKLVVTVIEQDGKVRVAALHTEEEGEAKSNAIDNEYSAGSLSVKKEVTGILGDKTKDFTVKVTFTAPEGDTVREAISYTDGTETKTIEAGWDTTAEATITLKHEETVTFTNIPYGVTYTVVEDDYTGDGYDAAEYAFDDENKEINSATENVKITNNKDGNVDTGISLDNMPYIMVLALVALGLVGFVSKKRSMEF
ncbi:MAG: hypothetical protein IJO55_05310 [Lachnospiraceae bacterium]|nr:hypothetical protein [Lachnospiraceae bacterium]